MYIFVCVCVCVCVYAGRRAPHAVPQSAPPRTGSATNRQRSATVSALVGLVHAGHQVTMENFHYGILFLPAPQYA